VFLWGIFTAKATAYKMSTEKINATKNTNTITTTTMDDDDERSKELFIFFREAVDIIEKDILNNNNNMDNAQKKRKKIIVDFLEKCNPKTIQFVKTMDTWKKFIKMPMKIIRPWIEALAEKVLLQVSEEELGKNKQELIWIVYAFVYELWMTKSSAKTYTRAIF